MSEQTQRYTLETTDKPKLDGPELMDLFHKSEMAFPACAILESYAGITFRLFDSAEDLPKNWATSFSGRIFNEQKEFRWIADGTSLRAWTIEDSTDDKGAYERILRPYYLYGTWEKGRFFEATVRRADLNYPIQGSPQDDDRAFVTVALYRPAKPLSWTGEDPAAIRARLNQPAFTAHRFLKIDYGRDK